MFELGGFFEFLIIAFAALILLGPREFSHILRLWGRWTFKWRQSTYGFRRYIDEHVTQGQRDAMDDQYNAHSRGDPSPRHTADHGTDAHTKEKTDQPS